MIRSPAPACLTSLLRRCLTALFFAMAICAPAAYGETHAPSASRVESRSPAHFTATDFIADDGAYLPLRRWLPVGPVKAVILALHGFNDYSNAFNGPALAWSAHGIATYAYDQRGFGGAPGRGLWPGQAYLAYDAVVASRILRLMYPGRPLYLLGESMGGAVATLAVTGAIPEVPGPVPVADADGVVLSAPAVWGRETMDLLPKVLLFAGVRLFPDKVLTGSGLPILASDNLPMLRALARDPMMLKGARIDAIYGLADLMDAALAAAPRLTAPTLLLYGAHDQVITRLPMAEFADNLPPEASGGRHRLAYYPQGYHLLTRDLHAATVVEDIAHWVLDRRSPLPSHADRPVAPGLWPPKHEP
jgi:alpha-beta hydrolase superfamily lysophospholipase